MPTSEVGGPSARRIVPLDSLPVAALVARDDRIIAVNAAYEAFMGASAAMIVGLNPSDADHYPPRRGRPSSGDGFLQ